MKPETRRKKEILHSINVIRGLNIEIAARGTAAKDAYIDEAIRNILKYNPKANPEKVRARLENHFNQIRGNQSTFPEPLTKEIQRPRIDCLIFFNIVQDGWGKSRKLPSGAVVVKDIPVCQMSRLGFPTLYRVQQASKRVRATCPEETIRYKQAHKAFLEICRRYNATQSETSWNHYVCGKGNKNSVAYRTKVDLRHKGGWIHFQTRRRLKYMVQDLLPRTQERKRARQEFREASATMSEMRKRIFEKMGVPPFFRSLVLSTVGSLK